MVVKKGKIAAKTAQKPVLARKKLGKKKGPSNENAKLQKKISKEPSTVAGEKRKRTSKTAQRPVLTSEDIGKTEGLSNEDVQLQEKISKEGLMKKGTVPKGNIALEGKEEKKFKGKTKIVKKELQKGKTKIGKKELHKRKKARSGGGDTPGIILLSCLPHGFYEKQMLQYFSQYGDVDNVRLVRSKKSGRSCGYGYVEFRHRVVAHLVAKSMNNYLTYGKIMKCRSINYSPFLSKKIFGEESFTKKNCPKVLSRTEAIATLNAERSEAQVQKRARRVVSGLNKKMLRLQTLGVNLDLNVDIGNISIKKTTQEEVPTEEKS